MGARRRGREAALQILCMADVCNQAIAGATHLFWGSLGEGVEGRPFADELLKGYVNHSMEVDRVIKGVSEHWRLERMSLVDRNLIRLGTYELIALPDVPRRVSLNEAVELAKRFGSENSANFINGILDRIASDLNKE